MQIPVGPINLFIQSRNRFIIFFRQIFLKNFLPTLNISRRVESRSWYYNGLEESSRCIILNESSMSIYLNLFPRIERALHNILYIYFYHRIPSKRFYRLLYIFFFSFFEKYFYPREMFVSGSYRQFIDSVCGIKRKGRDEKIEDGCCLDHRLFDF